MEHLNDGVAQWRDCTDWLNARTCADETVELAGNDGADDCLDHAAADAIALSDSIADNPDASSDDAVFALLRAKAFARALTLKSRPALAPAGSKQQVQIFDPADAKARIADITGLPEDADGFAGPHVMEIEISAQVRELHRFANDPSGGRRAVLVATPDMIEALNKLRADLPGFEAAVDVVLNAAVLSWRAGTPLRLPPMLLSGAPGVGKTYAVNRIAAALGVPVELIALNAQPMHGVFAGLNTAWKGARPGRIARTLFRGETAAPIFVLDEIDKPRLDRATEDALAPLLSLLEPENARAFVDDYLEIPFNASQVNFIATANDLTTLSPPLLDRLVIIAIPPQTDAQKKNIIQRMYGDLVRPCQAIFSPTLDDDLSDALSSLSPRQVRKLLSLAIPAAVAANQREISVDVLQTCIALLTGPGVTEKRGIGFTARW